MSRLAFRQDGTKVLKFYYNKKYYGLATGAATSLFTGIADSELAPSVDGSTFPLINNTFCAVLAFEVIVTALLKFPGRPFEL